MIVIFEKEYLRDLYITGKTLNKKHRFQPEIVKKYRRCIDTLISASGVESLFVIHSLNYEILKGDKQGVSSIRVNNQYRIEFIVKNEEIEPAVTICNIIELSNHYK
jgi:proteic killer suppression protein